MDEWVLNRTCIQEEEGGNAITEHDGPRGEMAPSSSCQCALREEVPDSSHPLLFLKHRRLYFMVGVARDRVRPGPLLAIFPQTTLPLLPTCQSFYPSHLQRRPSPARLVHT